MSNKASHNAKIKRYRDQSHKHRLELMITPVLKTRFSSLPGLEDATNAQRLAALCTLWEQQYPAVPIPAELLATEEASTPLQETSEQREDFPTLPENALPVDPINLDLVLSQLEAFDAELSAEDASEAGGPVKDTPKSFSLWDEPLPNVPLLPKKGYYPELDKAISRLHQQEWHRHKHGNSEEAKRWKRVLRAEPALMTAFRAMTANRDKLRELIKHCCLLLSPNELLAWFSLDEDDRQAVLWYLVHAASIHPEALGQVGERFKQALAAQPKRNFFSWELEPKA